MTLVLDESQVSQALDMPGAIAAMEALCREEAAEQTLSAEGATRVGVIGSGTEATSEMAALMAVRSKIRSGRVYSPRPERRAAFAQSMAATYGIEMEAVDEPARAVEDAEIVLCATGSR